MNELQERYYKATKEKFFLAMKDRWDWFDYREDNRIDREIKECEELAKEQGIELKMFNINE